MTDQAGLTGFTARLNETKERAQALAASGVNWITSGQMFSQFLLGGMADLEASDLTGSQKRMMLSSGLRELLKIVLPVLPIPGLPGWIAPAISLVRPVLRSILLGILAEFVIGLIGGAKSQLKAMGVFPADPQPAEPETPTAPENEESA